jgi:hypothetical protein
VDFVVAADPVQYYYPSAESFEHGIGLSDDDDGVDDVSDDSESSGEDAIELVHGPADEQDGAVWNSESSDLSDLSDLSELSDTEEDAVLGGDAVQHKPHTLGWYQSKLDLPLAAGRFSSCCACIRGF